MASGGAIVDASIVEVPKQRNTRNETNQIKKGNVPKRFKKNRHKRSQKDVDARWTRKNNVNYYGYKNHVMIDSQNKLIRSYAITPANVHDSVPAPALLHGAVADELCGDSAYPNPDLRELLDALCIKDRLSEKGCKHKKLTPSQVKSNHQKSKTRCRVEHVFGFMENTMNSLFIRTIGLTRAKCQIGLANLVYNICRYTQLQKA